MIRTRDFLAFAFVFLFLLTGITGTVLAQLWGADDQTANVITFSDGGVPDGVIAFLPETNYEENADRLRSKLQSGGGAIAAGGPVFTSVDTIVVASDTPALTDGTVPPRQHIGSTLDEQPLFSDDAWRFVGYTADQQIGIALDGAPIYGSRTDNPPLDLCGGIDEGSGYRYYLRPGQNFMIGCRL